MAQEYDLVIVGAGSGGLVAAAFAAQLGTKVALVERNRIGGDCTWNGCVPAKSLLKVAHVAHQMQHADRYGLSAIRAQVDLKAVMAYVRSVIDEVAEEESPEVLRSENIDVYMEHARFVDEHTLAVGEQRLGARHVLLCTGARPAPPPIQGLQDVPYLDYETVWEMDALPRRLLVVGGGPIGAEMSQAFQRLGSQVGLITGRGGILPRDDREAAAALAAVLTDEGVSISVGEHAERVWEKAGEIHLVAGESEFVGDALLVATGRSPVVEGLDLERAGIAYTGRGIEVDEQLRTSQRHIYAAGDCTGGPQFTHYAGWQAFMAVRNALLPGTSSGVSEFVPWTTFTDPEVAHVGLSETQAREAYGADVLICDWPMAKVDRARTEGDTAGLIKIVHRKDGTLLGVTIVAARAGETITEWSVALHHKLKVGDVASVIHVYPTYSTASQQAAAAIRVSQMLGGTTGRILRSLAHLMR